MKDDFINRDEIGPFRDTPVTADMVETVVCEHPTLGIPYHVNKADFDPAVHKPFVKEAKKGKEKE